MKQLATSRIRNQNRRKGNSSFLHSSSDSRSCLCEHIKDSIMWFGKISKLEPHCGLIFCLFSTLTYSFDWFWDKRVKRFLGYVSAESITATVGEDVILPFNYGAQHYSRHPVCRGQLSKHYLLLGDLDEGDWSSSRIRRATQGCTAVA